MSEQPVFSVVRGTPTVDEVAALVGVLLSRPIPAPPAPAPSRWARSGRPSGGLRPGPGGWQAAAFPHR